MPRIIAGTAGGIPIAAPPGNRTRPTADRVKESVFSIIQAEIPGRHVLDLFAGSGSLGMEALSRGAADAVFVDMDRKSCDVIRMNLEKTSLMPRSEILGMDTEKAIRILAANHRRFGLVFADAPYLRDFVLKTLLMLDENGIMEDNCMAVVEHHRGETPPDAVGRWMLQQRREYGETVFSFYFVNAMLA
jgi:16S rRNA (guanine966-N2)-methyltransferase